MIQTTHNPTRADAWQWAIDALQANNVTCLSTSDSPRFDARFDSQLIICHVLNITSAQLLAWPDKTLPAKAWQTYQQYIQRRLTGEPVAYIIGEQGFWNLLLKTNPSTLIPRPETEQLVEAVLALPLPTITQCLDLGTGTGAIGLALASERPQWSIMGIDKNVAAVNLAQHNAHTHQMTNFACQVSDWLHHVAGQWHCIVSNPPYIAENDPHLQQGDVAFEPHSALVAGQVGLQDIMTISLQATQHLHESGWLVFEHGYNQGAKVRAILAKHRFVHIQTQTDWNGHERITMGQWL